MENFLVTAVCRYPAAPGQLPGSGSAMSRRSQSLPGQEPNLNTLVERFGYALEHGERVPLVVGILKAANGRFGRVHPVGQLLLRETRFHPEVVNLSRDLSVDDLLFIFLFALRVTGNIAVVEKLRSF